jgi:hypothetical protein
MLPGRNVLSLGDVAPRSSVDWIVRWALLFLAACSAAPQPQNQPVLVSTMAAAPVEIDSDNDGVPDVCDHCPREPGVNSADHPYGRGCPWIDAFVGEHDALYPLGPKFRRGSATVSGDLADVIREMQTKPADRFFVIGHASEDEPDPVALGLRRAEAVASMLEAGGVSRSRLEIHSAGATHPELGDSVARRRVTFDLFHDHARRRAWDEARHDVEWVLPEDRPCR